MFIAASTKESIRRQPKFIVSLLTLLELGDVVSSTETNFKEVEFR